MPYTINEIQKIVTPIAIAHGVKRVSLFGSYSRGTADHNSDVDLLIEKGREMSLFQLSSLRLSLEDALNRWIWSQLKPMTLNFCRTFRKTRCCSIEKRDTNSKSTNLSADEFVLFALSAPSARVPFTSRKARSFTAAKPPLHLAAPSFTSRPRRDTSRRPC